MRSVKVKEGVAASLRHTYSGRPRYTGIVPQWESSPQSQVQHLLHCDFPQFHDSLNVAPTMYCAVLLLLARLNCELQYHPSVFFHLYANQPSINLPSVFVIRFEPTSELGAAWCRCLSERELQLLDMRRAARSKFATEKDPESGDRAASSRDERTTARRRGAESSRVMDGPLGPRWS
ncbi:hypothetical protein EYF80_015024 [Liparis tanakae]|uniref:Uncharacterized protein n=1 Tax=Liparis tanakae TaxID=230148 RepID=A0A4Z2I9K8_9TELE|nr:hypothetical protein EYF80_015024 [Liparis tanakae]